MTRLEHQFVDSAPPILEPGVMYVSIRHRTVLHLCACGCGHEVVTPLAPHRWKLTYDGETITIRPSVGNSALPCRSHYFITRNRIDWRRNMTDAGIAWARARDTEALAAAGTPAPAEPVAFVPPTDEMPVESGSKHLWRRVPNALGSLLRTTTKE